MLNDIQKGIVQNEINSILVKSIKTAINNSVDKLVLDIEEITKDLIVDITNQVIDTINPLTLDQFLKHNTNGNFFYFYLFDINKEFINVYSYSNLKHCLPHFLKYNVVEWWINENKELHIRIDKDMETICEMIKEKKYR